MVSRASINWVTEYYHSQNVKEGYFHSHFRYFVCFKRRATCIHLESRGWISTILHTTSVGHHFYIIYSFPKNSAVINSFPSLSLLINLCHRTSTVPKLYSIPVHLHQLMTNRRQSYLISIPYWWLQLRRKTKYCPALSFPHFLLNNENRLFCFGL